MDTTRFTGGDPLFEPTSTAPPCHHDDRDAAVGEQVAHVDGLTDR
jgi:hypothetical protein